MSGTVMGYFRELSERFGDAWNRFWFTPSDPGTLGALRLGTGLVALYFVATFGFDLVPLFASDGMLPVEVVRQIGGSERTTFSYLNYFTSPTELWVVHLIGVAVVTLFTIGCFTRITSVLALIVTLSYIHRGPMLTGQLEPILAMVQFYLCIGPAGARLSVDQLLAHRKARRGSGDLETQTDGAGPSVTATISIRLIQVHLSVVYAMMGISKLAEPDDTWWMGEAVWWLMAKPESRWVDGTWLYDHIYIINAWTHAIVLFELAFALLIWNRLARPLLLALSVVMWTSLALITGLGAWCAMMLVANLAFVRTK